MLKRKSITIYSYTEKEATEAVVKEFNRKNIDLIHIATHGFFNSESNESGLFVTCWMGILTLSTGELKFANAGHNSPYIIKKSGEVEVLPVSTNCMIGAIEQVEFKEATMQMEPGDMLVMFTDGVNEAVNTTFEEYGDERFESVLKDLHGNDSKTTIEGVLESVKSFTGEAPQSDDITLLALKRK